MCLILEIPIDMHNHFSREPADGDRLLRKGFRHGERVISFLASHRLSIRSPAYLQSQNVIDTLVKASRYLRLPKVGTEARG